MTIANSEDFKDKVKELIYEEALRALRDRISFLEKGLADIAEPSHYVLPAEAHALKSIAAATLKGDRFR